MKTFGEKLRAWRESRKLTGWMIEKALNIPNFRMVLSNVETGRRQPSDEFLNKLARLPEMELDAATMLAWRMMDEYNKDAIAEAAKAILSKEEIRALLEEASLQTTPEPVRKKQG